MTAARRVVAAIFVCLGALVLHGVVDATPWIGSPQIDAPMLDFRWSYTAQMIIVWGLTGVWPALVAALGMHAWSGAPPNSPGVRRIAVTWLVWFAAVGGFSLVSFMAFGTMGPLGVTQPIYRFAAVNGAVSATILTLLWALVASLLARVGRWPSPGVVFVLGAAASGLAACAFVGAVGAATSLPMAEVLGRWAPGTAILAVPTGLLLALMSTTSDVRARPAGA